MRGPGGARGPILGVTPVANHRVVDVRLVPGGLDVLGVDRGVGVDGPVLHHPVVETGEFRGGGAPTGAAERGQEDDGVIEREVHDKATVVSTGIRTTGGSRAGPFSGG